MMMSFGVITTTTGNLALSSTMLLGWFPLVPLVFTLGLLLHGLCLVAKEMLNHSKTRYRGRGLLGHVLQAIDLMGKTLLAAGLAVLPLYLVGYPLPHKGQYWKFLFLASAVYTLFKSLGILMQCPRDEDALIPRPRGSLPKVCAAALAAITILGYTGLCPERLLGWFPLVTLALTLGLLLHGLCLVVKEMLNHSKTRYRGQGLLGHVLQAINLMGKTLLAAGLAVLLLYLVGYSLPHIEEYWQLLFLASAVYTLFKSLGFLAPSEVEVPDICEGRKMNVAHGLDWSFYLGYLRLVLLRQ